jgi:spore coat protein U domain-containing protein, fimbrial subunit CupE1/2/3/6
MSDERGCKVTKRCNIRVELIAILILVPLIANVAYAAECAVSASPIVFSNYDTLQQIDVTTVGTITYTCFEKIPRIVLGLTKGYSGSFGRREMREGAHKLAYNLYLDPAGTQVWGDGSGGSQTYIAVAPQPGAKVTVTIFGRIGQRQNVVAGQYSDDVQVVLEY